MTIAKQPAGGTAAAAGPGRARLRELTTGARPAWTAAWTAAAIALLAGLGLVLGVSSLLVVEEALGLGVFAVATNLLIGYGGLVSFGQAAFYGAGAYTVALGWQNYHWSFWEGFALTPIVGAVLALPVGLIALRARSLYFALLTLAFSQLFYEIAENQYHFTGGANGVFGAMLPGALAVPRTGYFFVLAVAAVCLALLWKVTASPFGLTLRTIRENRARAEALGVNVFGHELLAFVVSGIFCSVAGGLFVVYSQSAYPELLDWSQSGYAVFMVVIGGMFTFLGPVLGAFVYTLGQQYLQVHTADWQLILGAVLLLIVLVRPDGLAGLLGDLARAVRQGAVRLTAGRPRADAAPPIPTHERQDRSR
ncbi:MAG: branched-chain amino acid ABC transporter permease [Streptosporangiaceae bacterium]